MLNWFKKKVEQGTRPPTTAPSSATSLGLESPRENTEAAGLQEENKKSFFNRLRESLDRTREGFVDRMDDLLLGEKIIDADLFAQLEEIMITSDLGSTTTSELLEQARERLKHQDLSNPQALRKILQQLIWNILVKTEGPTIMPATGPLVIMVLGVNGVGKTTTIGKLAYKFKKSGKKVLLVAADTFRAAATEQLQIWGKRVGCEVAAQHQGADPSSVIYDALDYARPRGFEVIIVDTAGRLHTKGNLMAELSKIKRVINKKIPGAPHEVMLVIDAGTGQNGISQARLFHQAVEVSGITLTKLDGTARGGIVVNICREFAIPIRFIGIGEQLEDLRDFDAQEFVAALFNQPDAGDGETLGKAQEPNKPPPPHKAARP